MPLRLRASCVRLQSLRAPYRPAQIDDSHGPASSPRRYPETPHELRSAEPGDHSILAEQCDILAPNADPRNPRTDCLRRCQQPTRRPEARCLGDRRARHSLRAGLPGRFARALSIASTSNTKYSRAIQPSRLTSNACAALRLCVKLSPSLLLHSQHLHRIQLPRSPGRQVASKHSVNPSTGLPPALAGFPKGFSLSGI